MKMTIEMTIFLMKMTIVDFLDCFSDRSAISRPNMNVPRDFPTEAWSPSGEVRSYPDMGANFPASGFSEANPPDLLDIRHLRRGYCNFTSKQARNLRSHVLFLRWLVIPDAAASFTDANIGRVMNALTSAGPAISENTISLLWSDHGTTIPQVLCFLLDLSDWH